MILGNSKQCPSCKTAISRNGGCNKMVCTNCGTYLCYRCNKAISGYEHFRDERDCALFPLEEIVIGEEQMNQLQMVHRQLRQLQRQYLANGGHLCPQCGQMNLKRDNNNHMCCWACKSYYCYLCKKMVRRGSQHFGPKGCRQHTTL